MDKYYELKIVVLLKKDTAVNEVAAKLSILVNGGMLQDEGLYKLHKDTGFKLYSFDNLYPLAKEGCYIKEHLYSFRVRSFSKDFIQRLKKSLYGRENDCMKVVVITEEVFYKNTIDELIALTPIMVTLPRDEKGRFDVNDLANIEDDILGNLVKKYNTLFGENISVEDVSHMFVVSKVSSKPIALKYKGVSLVGIKYRFKVSQDALSQELAFVAECVGLGEKNTSIGAGFCHAQYVK